MPSTANYQHTALDNAHVIVPLFLTYLDARITLIVSAYSLCDLYRFLYPLGTR